MAHVGTVLCAVVTVTAVNNSTTSLLALVHVRYISFIFKSTLIETRRRKFTTREPTTDGILLKHETEVAGPVETSKHPRRGFAAQLPLVMRERAFRMRSNY